MWTSILLWTFSFLAPERHCSLLRYRCSKSSNMWRQHPASRLASSTTMDASRVSRRRRKMRAGTGPCFAPPRAPVLPTRNRGTSGTFLFRSAFTTSRIGSAMQMPKSCSWASSPERPPWSSCKITRILSLACRSRRLCLGQRPSAACPFVSATARPAARAVSSP